MWSKLRGGRKDGLLFTLVSEHFGQNNCIKNTRIQNSCSGYISINADSLSLLPTCPLYVSVTYLKHTLKEQFICPSQKLYMCSSLILTGPVSPYSKKLFNFFETSINTQSIEDHTSFFVYFLSTISPLCPCSSPLPLPFLWFPRMTFHP